MEPPALISERAAAAIAERGGRDARRWLAGLADTAAELQRRHRNLHIDAALPGGALSAVSAGTLSGREVVVKICTNPGLAAAEAATLDTWSAAAERRGAPILCPQVVAVEADLGAYVMERVDGQPLRALLAAGDRGERDAAHRAAVDALEVIADTAALGSTPTAIDTLRIDDIRELAAGHHDRRLVGVVDAGIAALHAAATRPTVAAHGDLWTGNAMWSAGGRLHLIDPAPVQAPIDVDVARWCSDGWWGGGYRRRVNDACAATGADPQLVDALSGLYVAAQLATFTFHRWDATGIAAGIADTLEAVDADLAGRS
jgi:hypothetical protein